MTTRRTRRLATTALVVGAVVLLGSRLVAGPSSVAVLETLDEDASEAPSSDLGCAVESDFDGGDGYATPDEAVAARTAVVRQRRGAPNSDEVVVPEDGPVAASSDISDARATAYAALEPQDDPKAPEGVVRYEARVEGAAATVTVTENAVGQWSVASETVEVPAAVCDAVAEHQDAGREGGES